MTTAINSERLKLDDLEWFIELGELVGFKQFGFSEIRARQDAELTDRLRPCSPPPTWNGSWPRSSRCCAFWTPTSLPSS
jgi:hypothetical protein